MSDIYKYFNTPLSKIHNIKFLINELQFPNITDSETIKNNFRLISVPWNIAFIFLAWFFCCSHVDFMRSLCKDCPPSVTFHRVIIAHVPFMKSRRFRPWKFEFKRIQQDLMVSIDIKQNIKIFNQLSYTKM